jgi:hypothetical protein
MEGDMSALATTARPVSTNVAPQRERKALRRVFGIILILHGLAYALPGMLAAPPGAPTGRIVLATLTWAGATLGFMAAGFGLLGVRALRTRWAMFTALAALSAILLLALVRTEAELALSGAWLNVAILFTLTRVKRRDAAAAERGEMDAAVSRHPRLRGFTETVLLLCLLYAGVAIIMRPVHMRWGATDDELRMTLPGDERFEDLRFTIHHAVAIDAAPTAVWPWLAQIGQDRGAFYSYDWLENLFGLRLHNADRIHPEWQDLRSGGFVRGAPPHWLGGRLGERVGWDVPEVVVGSHLVLDRWGTFILLPGEKGGTRLLIRSRIGQPPLIAAPIVVFLFEPIHFVMEREMLLGISRRAEQSGR